MSFSKIIYAALMLFSYLSAEIIETKHFREILNHVQPKTLVILDIDDTLLIPVQTLGTDVWFCHKLAQYKKQMSSSEALDKTITEWEAVRKITTVKRVEDEIDMIIDKMQKDQVTVMGLSTQGLTLSVCTVNQLKALNIDLSKTAPAKNNCYFLNSNNGVLFTQGILFTAGTPKGKALAHFLDQIDYHPESIVFINDKRTHLEDLGSSFNKQCFTGLRYNYCDERISRFRPEIAEIQWKHSSFSHILSDEEAESLLKKNE